MKESEITSYIKQYEDLMRALQQIAEYGTFRLEDISDEIRHFYKQTYIVLSHLSDLKSLPLEELRVKRMLLMEWLEMVNNRTYIPEQHFQIVSALAADENQGVLPSPVASADKAGGEKERYYQIGFYIRWHYNYFNKGLEKVLAFITEATQPYHTPKTLDTLQQDYNNQVGVMLKEYLTTNEAAELMKTSVKTVLRRIEKGQLKATKQGNAPYRILRLDVEMWLAGH